ncbi:MAG: hypothetical protein E7289_07490 [Lachnospiraceae bacterium]|nr:hypothetical protein [Lachnospiraceae bacterium]
MWINQVMQQLWLGFLGLCAGLSVAGGVFTVFTAVGLVPRFAEHTKSANHVMKYENMIIVGCFLGNLFSLFAEKLLEADFTLRSLAQSFGASLSGESLPGASLSGVSVLSVFLWFVLAVVGIFTGVYVGTLAVSIAEMLDAIPIMAHRINLKRGVSLVIAGLAVGKLIGSLFYYMNGVSAW